MALINNFVSKILVNLESYNDYPKGARNNAKRAIDWKEKNGRIQAPVAGR